MIFTLYHKHFMLFVTTDEEVALAKVRLYSNWFDGVELRRHWYEQV